MILRVHTAGSGRQLAGALPVEVVQSPAALALHWKLRQYTTVRTSVIGSNIDIEVNTFLFTLDRVFKQFTMGSSSKRKHHATKTSR